MANADILCGLRDACERWSRGELGTDDLYHAVLGHLSALEGTGPWTTRAVQAFPDRIGRALWGPDPEHAGMPADQAAIDEVVRELQAWLADVEGGPAAAEPGHSTRWTRGG